MHTSRQISPFHLGVLQEIFLECNKEADVLVYVGVFVIFLISSPRHRRSSEALSKLSAK